jgi:hypothetical protein
MWAKDFTRSLRFHTELCNVEITSATYDWKDMNMQTRLETGFGSCRSIQKLAFNSTFLQLLQNHPSHLINDLKCEGPVISSK